MMESCRPRTVSFIARRPDSSMKPGPCRMIAAMDLRVASLAGAADQPLIRRQPAGQIRNSSQSVLVGAVGVALLTKERTRRHQQRFLVGAVSFMAVETVFAHGRMFPDERAAFFGVTGIADVIDGVGIEHWAGRRAVRVVAALARHLSFGQGHVRTFAEFGALLLVAGVAGLGNASLL